MALAPWGTGLLERGAGGGETAFAKIDAMSGSAREPVARPDGAGLAGTDLTAPVCAYRRYLGPAMAWMPSVVALEPDRN